MARELAEQDCSELAEKGPAYYGMPKLMFPLWRSFILEESDQAQIDMAQANARPGSNSLHKLIARITGIDPSMIDGVGIAGNILSVVPPTTNEQFREFLQSRNHQTQQ